jgi:hypothetical protein
MRTLEQLMPHERSRTEFGSLLTLSGIEVTGMWELPNRYWPRIAHEVGRDPEFIHYMTLREASPWWLVRTPVGMIVMGWRKRVINIDWSDTPVRAVITTDDVTKSETGVHAYSMENALRYLTALAALLVKESNR